MARIGFLGLGNMGGPMAANLVRAEHDLRGYDPSSKALIAAGEFGVQPAASIAEAVDGCDVVISMLPAGAHVRGAYLDEGGVLDAAPATALLVDCSTIDVGTARAVAVEAESRGFAMVDAPVSGGVAGAEGATLTFMVGGSDAAFERARPFLATMGKTIVHAGPSGNGQAAKICNNMILGVSMIAVSEAFTLAAKLGLSADKLFEISSRSSGQCWAMTSYCPVPGPVPASPANRNYRPGFAASMMLKDLKLAQQAALEVGAATPLGAEAAALYGLFAASGSGDLDFSAIIRFLNGNDSLA